MLSFHLKFVQTDRQTDEQTERRTTVKQYAPPPHLSIRGHKKEKLLVTSNFSFSHNVFHSYISSLCQNAAMSNHGLNNKSMGECNTILSAYTKYRHLG